MGDSIQLGKLKVDINENGNEVVYLFAGDVDENFKQEELPRVQKEKIIFDLAKLDTFNSIGIREWIHLVRDFTNLGSLHFVGCSVAMIDQINMVPDCAGEAVIESFQAPYFCSKCGEVNRTIVIEDHRDQLRQKEAPDFKCENDGMELEFDALEESYFLFLDNSKMIKDAS